MSYFRNKNKSLIQSSLVFFLAFLLLFSSVSPALAAEQESGVQPLTAENAEAFLDHLFAMPELEPYFVGASLVIVKDDEVIAQKGYGYADVASEAAVDPATTLFRIASVSKTFTAVAIMQLAEQGKLDLHTDIQAYLGELELDNPFDTPVTVAHLLTHQSGLEIRDPLPEDLHDDFEKFVALEDYIRLHLPSVVREPGTAYMYDNFAYLLLGLIVQNVSGEAYEDYMENHVFAPLEMENSGFMLNEQVLQKLATGYDPTKEAIDPYVFSPNVGPHGSMIATAEDVGKFMIAMLNDGKAPAGQLLSAESVEEMFVYRSQIHPLLPNSTYGFEAFIQIPGVGSPPAIVSKVGDLPGNSSLLLLIPEQKTGVFLTYNQPGVLRNIFFSEFIKAFFPEYAQPAALENNSPASAETLQQYSGLYADLRLASLISSIAVTDDGVLTISDALIGPRNLYQIDKGLFVDELTGQFTAFHHDEQTQATYMKEPYLNPLGYARQGAKPAGFADIKADHPYAEFIFSLQSLGYYPNDSSQTLEPEQLIKRGEIVRLLLEISGLKEGTLTTDLAFSDIENHPDAAYIQAAAEFGMIQGNGKGQFAPDRAVTRQEVAVMIWNLLRLQYPDELFANVEVSGDASDWAVPAIKMAVALGLYGPEVQQTADGSVDFLALQAMNRQEASALAYRLLTQPVDQIVAAMAAQ